MNLTPWIPTALLEVVSRLKFRTPGIPTLAEWGVAANCIGSEAFYRFDVTYPTARASER